LAISCFTCYSYRDNRDLHSFPTRRSSDLQQQDVKGKLGICVRLDHRADAFDPFEESLDVAAPHGAGRALELVEELDPADARAAIDRKSTRLNSSHEWISYAVFCLKKKKTR